MDRPARTACAIEVALLLAIGSALLWVNPLAAWRPYIPPDATEVYYGTRSLVERGAYTVTVNGQAHPPRYSYGYSVFLLAPVYRLTGRPEAIFAVPVLCAIINTALVYALTRRSFGAGAAVVAALLIFGLPDYGMGAWDVLSHVPSLTLFLLIALSTPTACGESWRGRAAALAIGLMAGLAVTIRPTNVLFLAPPAVLLLTKYSLSRPEVWVRGLAVTTGAVPFLAPLLRWNLHTFGGLTRTGYSYWCADLLDVPGTAFRMDSTLWDNFLFYAFPVGMEAESLWGIKGLGFVAVVVAAGQAVVGTVRAWRGSGPQRDFALFSTVTVAAVFALYLPYTFRFHWFAYPAYICLVPFLACGLRGLWPAIEGTPGADRRRLVGLAVLLVLCLARRWQVPTATYDPRLVVGEQFRELGEKLPDDGVLVSARDPLGVYECLIRGTRREYVPLNRSAEYAGRKITPRPPKRLTAEAIRAASAPVYKKVFEDDPEGFLKVYEGRKVLLEAPTAGYGKAPPGFDLVPIKAGLGLSLYEIRPKAR